MLVLGCFVYLVKLYGTAGKLQGYTIAMIYVTRNASQQIT